MKYKLILPFVVLWSGGLAHGAVSPFNKVSSDYVNADGSYEVPNMPPVRNQDSLPICFGMSAATVTQHYICKTENLDCKHLPTQKIVSPLSSVAWANTNLETGGVPELQNHVNIKFGGSGSLSLQNAGATDFIFQADSCYKLDQFANTYGNNEAAVQSAFKKLENFYEKNKNRKTEASSCPECAALQLGTIKPVDLQLALGEKNYPQFLYQLFFRDCPDIIQPKNRPKYYHFPNSSMDGTEYPKMISKIKEVLRTGYPLNLDKVCLVMEGKNCVKVNGEPAYHSLVISGYRKMCKPDGTCRDVVKVQNSWGNDWQKSYDDGWVDAKTLIESTTADTGKYSTATLSWYSNPKDAL